MGKNIVALTVCLLFLITSNSLPVHANSVKDLPTSKTSDHWKVVIGERKIDNIKPNERTNIYSVRVENIGKKAYDIQVEVYRDEPNTKTMYWLTTDDIPSTRNFYEHQNLPLSTKAKTIEVVVTWRDKQYEEMRNGQKYPARKFKQTFKFEQK